MAKVTLQHACSDAREPPFSDNLEQFGDSSSHGMEILFVGDFSIETSELPGSRYYFAINYC